MNTLTGIFFDGSAGKCILLGGIVAIVAAAALIASGFQAKVIAQLDQK